MKKRMLLTSLLSVLACCFMVGGVTAATSRLVQGAVPALEQNYSKNQTLQIPDKEISVNGQKYAATKKIIYPNGTTSVVDETGINLSSSGLYTVVYYVVVKGEYYEETENFTVNEDSYTINGKKSTVKYGHHDEYATDENGLVMAIAAKESVQYNKIVDLKEFKQEPVITLFVTPETLGTQDASVLKVTFTDIYDPTNVIVLKAKRINYDGKWAENGVYTQAGSDSLGFAGLESRDASAPSAINVLGGYYGRHGTKSEYGAPVSFSLCGFLEQNEEIGDRQYQIFWDYEEKAIYHGNTKERRLVTELDNYIIYDNPWQGFTTGEVFVSFSAENYTAGAMNLVVKKIGDHDLAQTDFTITEKPIIDVDYNNYEESDLPSAIVGMPYKAFDVSGWDFYDKEVAVTTRVYYGYYGNNPYLYPVKNGTFTPDRAGVYTIEYSTKNKQGLVTKKTLDIKAVSTSDTLDINVVGASTQLVSGNNVKVADNYEITNVSGRSEIAITATLKSNPEICYEVDTQALTFSPYYAGVYEIKYAVSDYVTKTEKTIDCMVTANAQPFIQADVSFPEEFIVGNTYKLPTEVYAYDLSSGAPVQIKTTLMVQEENNVIPISDGYYKVGETENVTIIYMVDASGKHVETSFVVPTVNVKKADGNYDVTKFFKADKASASVSADYSFVKLGAAEDTEFTFIAPLRADMLDMLVSFQKVGFNKVSMYLTEVNDMEKSVKITLESAGKSIAVYVNDTFIREISNTFNDFKSKSLNVVYDGASIALGELLTVALSNYQNGKQFAGFDGNIILRVALEDVREESEVAIVKINNQYMYEFDSELIEPEVIVKMLVGERAPGDIITLSPASGYDVLTGCVQVKLQVKDPDGTVVTANDGTVLNFVAGENTYAFTLTKYGRYNVSYQAQDTNGNHVDYSYVIFCADVTSPKVQLSQYKMTAKVGDTVKVPQLTVTDNLTEAENLKVYTSLLMADGRIVQLTGEAFQVNKAGTYKIYYSVYDETGNVTQVYCELLVTA